MKKIISILLLICICVSLFGCGAEKSGAADTDVSDVVESSANKTNNTDETIVIRYNMGSAEGSTLDVGARYMGELLDEWTDGRITVEVYNSNALGSDRELIEALALGDLEMANIATGTVCNFSEAFKPLDLPYVVKDRETAYKVLDGEEGREVLDTLEASNIKGLSFWELGWRVLYNNIKEINTPADMKDVKIRTMENDIYLNLFNGIGAYAIAMSVSELYTALQQGTVNACENPIGAQYEGGYYEVVPYVSVTNHVYCACVSMISMDFWNSLSADDQELIVKADAMARDYCRNFCAEQEGEYYQKWIDAGGTVTYVDTDLWAEECSFVVDSYADEIDMDFVAALRGEK